MKVRLAAALVVLAVIGGACSWRESGSIATVDGRGIDRDLFLAEMEAFADRPNLASILTNNRVRSAPSEGKYDVAFASNRLTSWIQTELAQGELLRRNVSITDDDIARAETQLAKILEEAGQLSETASFAADAPAEYESLPTAQRDAIVRITAIQAALRRELAVEAGIPADPQRFAEASPRPYLEVCLSLIIGEVDAVVAAQARLANGEDFAAIANEINPPDLPENGEVGCGTPAELPPDVAPVAAQAEVGEISDMIEIQGGSYLAIVTSRADTIDAANPALGSIIESEWRSATQEPWAAWWQEHGSAGEVDVDPKIGVWDPTQFRVRAPEGSTAPAP